MSVITCQYMLHDINCYDIDHELLCFGIGFGGVRSLANFIQMSCDELVFWVGSYECASSLVHLKGHLMMTLERE